MFSQMNCSVSYIARPHLSRNLTTTQLVANGDRYGASGWIIFQTKSRANLDLSWTAIKFAQVRRSGTLSHSCFHRSCKIIGTWKEVWTVALMDEQFSDFLSACHRLESGKVTERRVWVWDATPFSCSERLAKLKSKLHVCLERCIACQAISGTSGDCQYRGQGWFDHLGSAAGTRSPVCSKRIRCSSVRQGTHWLFHFEQCSAETAAGQFVKKRRLRFLAHTQFTIHRHYHWSFSRKKKTSQTIKKQETNKPKKKLKNEMKKWKQIKKKKNEVKNCRQCAHGCDQIQPHQCSADTGAYTWKKQFFFSHAIVHVVVSNRHVENKQSSLSRTGRTGGSWLRGETSRSGTSSTRPELRGWISVPTCTSAILCLTRTWHAGKEQSKAGLKEARDGFQMRTHSRLECPARKLGRWLVETMETVTWHVGTCADTLPCQSAQPQTEKNEQTTKIQKKKTWIR